MSERQEKIKRRNLRWRCIEKFDAWLDEEPPMLLFWKWARWKLQRPSWSEMRKAARSDERI